MHVKSVIALFLLVAMVALIAPIPSTNIASAQGTGYKRVILPATLTEPIEIDGEGGVVELTGSTNIDYFGDTDVITVYDASKVIVSVSLYGKAVGTVDEFHVLYIDADEIVINSLSANMKVIVFGTDWYDTRVFEFYAYNKITIGTINLRLTVSSPDEITILEMYSGGEGGIVDGRTVMPAYDINSIDNYNFVPTDTIGTINMMVTAKHITTDEEESFYVYGLTYESTNKIKINDLRIDIVAYASKTYDVYLLGAIIMSQYEITINSVRVPRLLVHGGEYLEGMNIYGIAVLGPYWFRGTGVTTLNNPANYYENNGEEYKANIGTLYIGNIGIGNERAVGALEYAYVAGLYTYYINIYIKRIIIRNINVPKLSLEYFDGCMNYYYIYGIENYDGVLKYDIMLMLGVESGMPIYTDTTMISRSGKKLLNLVEIEYPVNLTGTFNVILRDNGFIDVYDPDLGEYRTYALSRGDRVKIVFSKTTIDKTQYIYATMTLTKFGLGAYTIPIYKVYINGELVASNTMVNLALGKASVRGSVKVYNSVTGELIDTLQPLTTAASGFFTYPD